MNFTKQNFKTTEIVFLSVQILIFFSWLSYIWLMLIYRTERKLLRSFFLYTKHNVYIIFPMGSEFAGATSFRIVSKWESVTCITQFFVINCFV